MHPVSVVAALLAREGKVFVQKRASAGALPDLWEFPGGKVEVDESHAEALRRECQEELGISICVRDHLVDILTESGSRALYLHLYWAELASPEAVVKTLVAAEGKWLAAAELRSLTFCPADVPVVDALATGQLALLGRWPGGSSLIVAPEK